MKERSAWQREPDVASVRVVPDEQQTKAQALRECAMPRQTRRPPRGPLAGWLGAESRPASWLAGWRLAAAD